jgi:hypothetical protein
MSGPELDRVFARAIAADHCRRCGTHEQARALEKPAAQGRRLGL